MRVEVWFDKASQPVVFEDATATYQKGDLLCVAQPGRVTKYPLDHIFCLKESDFVTSRPKKDTDWKEVARRCVEQHGEIGPEEIRELNKGLTEEALCHPT